MRRGYGPASAASPLVLVSWGVAGGSTLEAACAVGATEGEGPVESLLGGAAPSCELSAMPPSVDERVDGEGALGPVGASAEVVVTSVGPATEGDVRVPAGAPSASFSMRCFEFSSSKMCAGRQFEYEKRAVVVKCLEKLARKDQLFLPSGTGPRSSENV
jgi:hypothetical protein